jgi:N-acetylglucosamine-6-sulfatase
MPWLLCILVGLCALAVALEQAPLVPEKRPNIVFILTDDQDLHMDSLDYMPLLQKYIINEGTFYKRHYCSTAICCPSRVTLWTGKYAHNTNVTDVFPPYGESSFPLTLQAGSEQSYSQNAEPLTGGYPKFVSQGLNENYLPIWLQEAGYKTFYTGKLFNAHSVQNYDNPFPAGWTESDFLLDPYTYQYLNTTTQRNRDPPVSWEGHYSTDVLAEKAYGLLNDAIALQDPFFLTIATSAPHSNVGTFDLGKGANQVAGFMTEPIPAERHKDLFAGIKVPRRENFNPNKVCKMPQ